MYSRDFYRVWIWTVGILIRTWYILPVVGESLLLVGRRESKKQKEIKFITVSQDESWQTINGSERSSVFFMNFSIKLNFSYRLKKKLQRFCLRKAGKKTWQLIIIIHNSKKLQNIFLNCLNVCSVLIYIYEHLVKCLDFYDCFPLKYNKTT